MDQTTKLIAKADFNIVGPGFDPGSGPIAATSAFEKIIGRGIAVLTIAAVVYFIFQIILAGYAFITSEGDEKKIEVARHRITDNIIGLVVIIVALGLGSLLAKIFGLGNILDFNSLDIWAN